VKTNILQTFKIYKMENFALISENLIIKETPQNVVFQKDTKGRLKPLTSAEKATKRTSKKATLKPINKGKFNDRKPPKKPPKKPVN
jgi:hypothetical protein